MDDYQDRTQLIALMNRIDLTTEQIDIAGSTVIIVYGSGADMRIAIDIIKRGWPCCDCSLIMRHSFFIVS